MVISYPRVEVGTISQLRVGGTKLYVCQQAIYSHLLRRHQAATRARGRSMRSVSTRPSHSGPTQNECLFRVGQATACSILPGDLFSRPAPNGPNLHTYISLIQLKGPCYPAYYLHEQIITIEATFLEGCPDLCAQCSTHTL